MNNTSKPQKIDRTKLKKVAVPEKGKFDVEISIGDHWEPDPKTGKLRKVPNPETIEAMKEPRGKAVTIEEVFKELDK